MSVRLRQKEYELADHLGNVRVRVSDLKRTSTPGSAPYTVDERGYQEYYPFGMLEPNRGATLQGLTPRFGYNGKEMDNDVNNRNGAAGQNGGGNSYDYGARMYNPRLGRFLSEDPLAPEYPWYTPYQFAGNTPIQAVDLDGEEPKLVATYYYREINGRREFLHVHYELVGKLAIINEGRYMTQDLVGKFIAKFKEQAAKTFFCETDMFSFSENMSVFLVNSNDKEKTPFYLNLIDDVSDRESTGQVWGYTEGGVLVINIPLMR